MAKKNKPYYYFVSYQAAKQGNTYSGSLILKVVNNTLKDMSDYIKEAFGFDKDVVIMCLKDLTKDEYEMLIGKEDNNDD